MKSELITDPETREELTTVHLTDARTAMQRGLKEYLETWELPAGFQRRDNKLVKVVSGWAEANELSSYPSAAVYGIGAGEYDNANHPWVREENRMPDGSVIVITGELAQNFRIEIWCTDPTERYSWASVAEDRIWPVDWMSGFRLVLPHYHNVTSDFEPMSMDYLDTEVDDARRYRKLALMVRGHIAVAKSVFFPDLIVENVVEEE